jgi:hypothetical protein
VSFVGRPFPLEEADEHFSRLKHWGFTFLRFLITWEAIEHSGPGIYDLEYLEYLEAVIRKAGEHGFRLFIDPHQDVWSRFTGGDGAPGWTLEAAGLEMRNFAATGAAVVHQVAGDPFPRMIWPSNGVKLAAATMFTLFFGGDEFAPRTRVDGEPIQGYLQRHYLDAMRQVAMRLRQFPFVIGYDTLNEPLPGYIGWAELSLPHRLMRIGPTPTPFESMMIGDGFPADVEVWEIRPTGIKKRGVRRIDPAGTRAWVDGRECIWREHGVWDVGGAGDPRLLRPGYFAMLRGRALDFGNDFYKPFVRRFAEAIRSADPDAALFVEGSPHEAAPRWGKDDADRIVYAPHWYDDFVLVMKSFQHHLAFDAAKERVVFGAGAIRRSFREQLAVLKQEARDRLMDAPTLLAEVGIPLDMKGKRSYRTGDFEPQARALDRTFRAIEDNLLSCTLWNYTPDNDNLRGDQWNDEDLSLFSRDQQGDRENLDSGGRALQGAIRPYPMAVAGEPLKVSFDPRSGDFELAIRDDPEVDAATEIFVPRLQYARGYTVAVSDGAWEERPAEQVLEFRHERNGGEHTLRLTRR